MSTPPRPGPNMTAVVVCVTLLVAFVFAGYVYLEVRGRSSMAITTLIMQLITAAPGVLAYLTARRAKTGVDVVAQQTNGTLRTSQALATRALGALPPHKADAIVHEVVGASPPDEPGRGATVPRSP